MRTEILKPPVVINNIAKSYKNGYSPILLFCGRMRVGKTTKAYLIAHWLSWLVFGHAWDWRNNTIVTMKQLIQKMDSNAPEILLMDECQRILGKKDFMKSQSRLFDMLITSQAYKHYIVILILPKASNLGTDHAVNVNYVFPCHSRTMLYPYRVDSNSWDIALRQRKLEKFPCGYFHLDIKAKYIKEAFENELVELSEFKKLIETNLKEPIMDEAKIKEGLMDRKLDELPTKTLILKSNNPYI